ncbi:MAG: hypothetical protein WD396_04530 [Pseudohongiellaceae bacterium]
MTLLRRLLVVLAISVIVGVAVLVLVRPDYPPRLQYSDSPAYIPAADDSFVTYLEQNERRIRQALAEYYFLPGQSPFLGRYSLDEVAAMRAPYEIAPATACEQQAPGERQGVLLLHGLTDSPYLTRHLAARLRQDFPCALIRGLLTPGHGTVPGDLRAVDRQDWRQTVDFGVASFAAEVDALTVVGYSNGSTLALDYLNRHPGQTLIKRLVLVVPALGVESGSIWLTPYLRLVRPWLSQLPDTDAVKYESSSAHGIAEFYRLTNEVRSGTRGELPVPVLMLVSGDDTTVDRQLALQYFCDHADKTSSHLLWFAGSGDTPLTAPCAGIEVIDFDIDDPRFISYSHVALMIPPDDPHYGRDGNYPVCLGYLADNDRFSRCLEAAPETVYVDAGRVDETGLYDGRLVRRPTFNPRFDRLHESVRCFIAPDCRLSR